MKFPSTDSHLRSPSVARGQSRASSTHTNQGQGDGVSPLLRYNPSFDREQQKIVSPRRLESSPSLSVSFSPQPKQPQRGTSNRRVRIRGGRGQHRINNVGARRQLQIGDPDISFQPEQLDDSVGLGKQVYKRLKKCMLL